MNPTSDVVVPSLNVDVAHTAHGDGRTSTHITMRRVRPMATRDITEYRVYVFRPGIVKDRRAAKTWADKQALASWSDAGYTRKRKATRTARSQSLALARMANSEGWVGEVYDTTTGKLFHQWRIASDGLARRGNLKLVAVVGYAFAAKKPARKATKKATKKAAGRKVTKAAARSRELARRGVARRLAGHVAERSLKRSTTRGSRRK